MVAVLVVQDGSVVRTGGTVTPAGCFDKGAFSQHRPTGTQVNLAGEADRLIFRNVVADTWEPVVAALEGQPAVELTDTVPRSVQVHGGVVGVDHDDHGWQRRSSQLAQQTIDVSGHQVEMVIGVDFTKAGCLDIAGSILFT